MKASKGAPEISWIIRYALVLTGVLLAGAGAGLARPALAYYVRYDLGATVVATASLQAPSCSEERLAA
jgi:hypothetical protein